MITAVDVEPWREVYDLTIAGNLCHLLADQAQAVLLVARKPAA